MKPDNPSGSFAASSPYTGEPKGGDAKNHPVGKKFFFPTGWFYYAGDYLSSFETEAVSSLPL